MNLKFLFFALLTNFIFSQTNHELDWGMSSTNQQITIDVGDSVTWTWGNGTHNLRSTGGIETFDSGYFSGPGPQFSHTFTTPGVTTYICDPHPNSMFGAVTVVGTASVVEQSLLNLSLYPNPASNIINLSIENLSNVELKIELYDVIGRLNKTVNTIFENNKASLDISKLTRGIYIVKVTNGNEVSVKRFVKE